MRINADTGVNYTITNKRIDLVLFQCFGSKNHENNNLFQTENKTIFFKNTQKLCSILGKNAIINIVMYV